MPQNYTPINDLIKIQQVGSASQNKEVEPLHLQEIEVQEVVEHEPAPELHQFIEPRKETFNQTPELQQVGAVVQEEPKFQQQQTITLPISDDKVVAGLKQPVTSSWRWLAEWAMYILKSAHLTLKKVHGHLKRVAFS